MPPPVREFCAAQQEFLDVAEDEVRQVEGGEVDAALAEDLSQRTIQAFMNSLNLAPAAIREEAETLIAILDESTLTERQDEYLQAFARVQGYTKETCGFDPKPRRGT